MFTCTRLPAELQFAIRKLYLKPLRKRMLERKLAEKPLLVEKKTSSRFPSSHEWKFAHGRHRWTLTIVFETRRMVVYCIHSFGKIHQFLTASYRPYTLDQEPTSEILTYLGLEWVDLGENPRPWRS